MASDQEILQALDFEVTKRPYESWDSTSIWRKINTVHGQLRLIGEFVRPITAEGRELHRALIELEEESRIRRRGAE